MTYQEKKCIVLGVLTLTTSLLYYFLFKDTFIVPNLSQAEAFRSWASFILILIPIQIVLTIVVTIFFNIVANIGANIGANIENSINNNGQPVEPVEPVEVNYEIVDELVKQVDMKASMVSYAVFGISFFAGLLSQVFLMPAEIMFTIFFFGIVLSSLANESAKLFYFRRGF
jgi:hypothetical protein